MPNRKRYAIDVPPHCDWRLVSSKQFNGVYVDGFPSVVFLPCAGQAVRSTHPTRAGGWIASQRRFAAAKPPYTVFLPLVPGLFFFPGTCDLPNPTHRRYVRLRGSFGWTRSPFSPPEPPLLFFPLFAGTRTHPATLAVLTWWVAAARPKALAMVAGPVEAPSPTPAFAGVTSSLCRQECAWGLDHKAFRFLGTRGIRQRRALFTDCESGK
jgi:hypothetical protein